MNRDVRLAGMGLASAATNVYFTRTLPVPTEMTSSEPLCAGS